MLEVQIVIGLGARHDEDQVCHDRLRRIPNADYFSLCFTQERTPGRRRALGAVQREAERSEDSATRETEGGYDELQESCGHTRSADVVVALYEETNRLGFHVRSGSAVQVEHG